ncbi:MAG TPA: phosphoribosylanthranilate isomerase [Ignavibacteriaceae bacterium]|nr:phosphoribosylanthranilate isomerase [Ignavibacteriaceae bacterium]
MKPINKPRIKICCINSMEEAQLAISIGASAIGLVSEMPSGPGVISEDKIIEIAGFVPPPVATFLLTSKTDANEIIAQQKRLGTNTIQIVDKLISGTHKEIKESLPGIRIVQVIHVLNDESIDEAVKVSENVDAILLDSGNPNLEVKELGGTGRRHNWDISRRIREAIKIPVFLAGGLNYSNVREAIDAVSPFALDVCSGVRTNGNLDPGKLKLFFDEVNNFSY